MHQSSDSVYVWYNLVHLLIRVHNLQALCLTVVAIAFGSLHNLTTRVLTPVEPGQARGGWLQRLLGGLGGRGKEKGD